MKKEIIDKFKISLMNIIAWEQLKILVIDNLKIKKDLLKNIIFVYALKMTKYFLGKCLYHINFLFLLNIVKNSC